MSRPSRNGGFPNRSRGGRPPTGPNYGGQNGGSCACNPIEFPNSGFITQRQGGRSMDPGMAWITNDLGLSNIMAQQKQSQMNKRMPQPRPMQDDRDDERFLVNNLTLDDQEPNPETVEKEKMTLMEWFDRNVERELKKRRAAVQDENYEPTDQAIPKKGLPVTDEFMDRMAQSGAGGIEIETNMRFEPDSELAAAAEKLAMAEAMIEFAGAVKAAEAAVEMAPPDKMEEAAVQGVKAYSMSTSGGQKEEVTQDNKPVEILGYIGITRPKPS